MRIGHGIDFHRLVENRELILGGIKIPYEKGLLGHSDADVLTHAIMDAILGALAKRDIGFHFPDTDSSYKDINSLVLLKRVREIMLLEAYKIENIDATVIAQEPKLSSYVDMMRERIARALEIPTDLVSIKATTTEKMGYVGRLEGIEAHAVVLLEKEKE